MIKLLPVLWISLASALTGGRNLTDSEFRFMGTRREHRLYQADWLMRFYDFSVDEIVPEDHSSLDLDQDPKLMWALRNRDKFPIDINKACKRDLLRIPGFG